jgi:hypothetical protein
VLTALPAFVGVEAGETGLAGFVMPGKFLMLNCEGIERVFMRFVPRQAAVGSTMLTPSHFSSAATDMRRRRPASLYDSRTISDRRENRAAGGAGD